jgi:hypothetical protein
MYVAGRESSRILGHLVRCSEERRGALRGGKGLGLLPYTTLNTRRRLELAATPVHDDLSASEAMPPLHPDPDLDS